MQEEAGSVAEHAVPNQSLARRLRQMNIAEGRFILSQRIGSGAFGELFQGLDIRTNSKVAVKFEKRQIAYPQLSYENKVYRVLHQGQCDTIGIPRIHYFGVEGEYSVLVMDLCGPSLEDLFNYCGRRFSLKTVCMLADQMLQRVEFLHGKGFIHRDLKPENFVFGIGRRGHVLHLIDFGLSKLYWNKRKQLHIPFCEGKTLTGTARYCSTWTHRGFEQSRRDDLESIGFIIIYFLLGSLPWQGIMVRDAQQKTARIGEKKLDTSLEILCAGLPAEILQYCLYCRELRFTDAPDYNHLRELFLTLAKRIGCVSTPVENGNGGWWDGGNSGSEMRLSPYDWMFDWFLKRGTEVEEWRHRQKAKTPSNNVQNFPDSRRMEGKEMNLTAVGGENNASNSSSETSVIHLSLRKKGWQNGE
ncbi:casein kinase, putative [Trypanosoma cruzi marinkellei]|uniref:non-specific serine/threonine protein kinase n=1 Tax=Trypanosoma cruzi marinkellei TaxID=85056 RepID=K2NQH5_TRYCR|nr:casein kinase, putative [Trypanosoma cruzi marinkellei]EKF31122.1 casein kinase, putative [Trypanosoma cruzi marinkellei]